jgi:hypothetical protein
MEDGMREAQDAAVDLLWIPLGAGGPAVVRLSGRTYEAIVAFAGRRSRRDIYHSALEVTSGGDRFAIEVTPVPDRHGPARGVVGEGAVGTRWAGALRVFRYEVRCWRGGVIPDAGEALGGPTTVSDDPAVADAILGLVPSVPLPVWGRDELHAGEMWNSNSVVSWLLERAGVDTDALARPPRGRAPGWDAGVVVARRAG